MNQSGQSSALFKMKKVILQLGLDDDKDKQQAKRIVYGIAGIDSVDMEDKKLTVIGDIDPVDVVSKLGEFCPTAIVSVGPAMEPEKKKDEPKKDEPKAIYVQSMEEDPNACVIC